LYLKLHKTLCLLFDGDHAGQIHTILAWIEEVAQRADAIIFTGDFNATPSEPCVAAMFKVPPA
jgi:hypothetical protein